MMSLKINWQTLGACLRPSNGSGYPSRMSGRSWRMKSTCCASSLVRMRSRCMKRRDMLRRVRGIASDAAASHECAAVLVLQVLAADLARQTPESQRDAWVGVPHRLSLL